MNLETEGKVSQAVPNFLKHYYFGSSHLRCSVKKGVLRISQNSQENACARDSFLIKLQARASTLLKKSLWYRCLPVNFEKFLRTAFLQNTPDHCFCYFHIKQPISIFILVFSSSKSFYGHLKNKKQ